MYIFSYSGSYRAQGAVSQPCVWSRRKPCSTRTTTSFLHQSGLNWPTWLPAAWTTSPRSGPRFVPSSATSTASSRQVSHLHPERSRSHCCVYTQKQTMTCCRYSSYISVSPRLRIDHGQWHPAKPDCGVSLVQWRLWEPGAGSVWRETPYIPSAAGQGVRKGGKWSRVCHFRCASFLTWL